MKNPKHLLRYTIRKIIVDTLKNFGRIQHNKKHKKRLYLTFDE